MQLQHHAISYTATQALAGTTVFVSYGELGRNIQEHPWTEGASQTQVYPLVQVCLRFFESADTHVSISAVRIHPVTHTSTL